MFVSDTVLDPVLVIEKFIIDWETETNNNIGVPG